MAPSALLPFHLTSEVSRKGGWHRCVRSPDALCCPVQFGSQFVAPPLKLHAFESYVLEGALHGLELFVEEHDVSLASFDDRPQRSLLNPALS